MDVVTLGDSLLRKRSALVNDIDQGIRDFVGAMFDTLHERKGIGLAAVQSLFGRQSAAVLLLATRALGARSPINVASYCRLAPVRSCAGWFAAEG